MKVKMILPALTEATSPFWRPIKYSLFPPLGLATLAGYLRTTTRSRFRTSTSSRSTSTTRPTWWSSRSTSPPPTAPISSPTTTGARGAYVALGGLHVTSLPDEAAAHADTIFLGPGEDTWPQFLADFTARAAPSASTNRRCARWRALPPIRRDLIKRAPVPRAELDRRLARLSARLRLLLQGGLLRGRQVLLYPDRRRRAGRDRASAGPPPLFPGRSPVRRSPLRRRALRRHARHGPPVAGGGHGQLGARTRTCWSARSRPACAACSSASKRSTRPTSRAAQVPEPEPRLRRGHPPAARPRRDGQRQLRVRHGRRRRRRSSTRRSTGRSGRASRRPRSTSSRRIRARPVQAAWPQKAASRLTTGTATTRATSSSGRRACRQRSWRTATGGPTATSTAGRSIARGAAAHDDRRWPACATSPTPPAGRNSSRSGTGRSARKARGSDAADAGGDSALRRTNTVIGRRDRRGCPARDALRRGNVAHVCTAACQASRYL